MLLALGALTGLAIAGYGLFTASGTATRGVPPEAIATVNRRLILRTDYVTQVQTQFGVPFAEATAEQKQRVLDDMIAEELMVQRGLDADLASYDPEVRQALVNGVELQIFADVLASQPAEEQLREHYAKHKERYVRDGIMQLRDLVVPPGPQGSADQSMQSARAAVDALRHGAQLDAVMEKYQLKDSRKLLDSGHVDLGDVFDFSAQARLDPAVFKVAAALKAGEISEPVAAADGIHLIVMSKREPPRQREYAEVANEVWADLKKEAQARVRNANLGYLRGKADVQIADAK